MSFFEFFGGDQIFFEQSQLLTQHNELATDASDGLAVVFSEVGDGFEIRHQPPCCEGLRSTQGCR
jgi:hypothetical protein